MVSIFLVVSAVVLSIIILSLVALAIINFSHPDDSNEALFPKLVVLFGIYLACVTVLVLPYDVANSRGDGGGLDIDILWQMIFIVDAVLLVLVIPYAFFFYESEPDLKTKEEKGFLSGQSATALKYTTGFFLIFLMILLIMYFTLGTADIPITRIRQSTDLFIPLTDTNSRSEKCPSSCQTDEIKWELQVSFPIYVIALLSFIGWFLFALFGGIGIFALPLDLINEYRTRPVPISASEYASKKLQLGKRAQDLLEVARVFQNRITDPGHRNDRKVRRSDKKTQNELEASFYLLENEFKAARQSYIDRGGNPIWYWFKLSIGCIGLLVSTTWVLHICIFVLPEKPPTHFLNVMFIDLETFIPGFPLIGVLFFAFYSLYLLWCAVKGNFRFGLRIPLFFKIYPMELNNTLMNAFLFNTWLILLCSTAVLQFCAISFPVYARLTDIENIFGTQVRFLRFFTYFFDNNVFVIMFLVLMGLSALTMILFPKNKALEIEKRIKRIAAGDNSDDDKF